MEKQEENMNKLELFYENVIDFINHCAVQEFIPEDEEEYIVAEITKIKEQVENGDWESLNIK